MKSKNIEQKLELNKETIANLEWTEMKKIRGGQITNVDSECSTVACAIRSITTSL